MSGLQLLILDSPSATSQLILDASPFARGLKFSTNRHGFAGLGCFLSRSLQDSFLLYDRPGLPHVVVTKNGYTAWEGRLEDVAVMGGGVRLGALGYWRALSDVPYTSLWSTTKVAEAFTPNGDYNAAYSEKERFNLDNNNRLFVGLTKNNAYTLNKAAGWLFSHPNDGRKQIATISMDYDFLASANCTFRVVSFDWSSDTAFASGAVENSIVGDGTPQSGSLDITLASDKDIAGIDLIASTAHTYTGETAAEYLKVTNVRVKTTTESTVRGGSIAADILNAVNNINSNQIQTVSSFISNTAFDLHDEIYEDAYIPHVLDRLAMLGDGTNIWETGVWENRILHFRRRGSVGKSWYVDLSALEIERTLEILNNSVYANYQDTSGRALRTAASADTFSVSRYGVTRRASINANTTSSTQAESHRDTFLADRKDPIPRAGIDFRELFDANGIRYPNYMLRSGDTVTIRNIPPTTSSSIDRIRTFLADETEYDEETDTINVTPESRLPTLDVMISRQAAGEKFQLGASFSNRR